MTKKIVNYLVIAVIGVAAAFTSCDDPVEEISKESGFSNPKEFLANPAVSNAIKATGMNIHNGNNPPILDGTYSAEGEIINASGIFEAFVGSPDEREFILSGQALLGQNLGKLNFHEKHEGVVLWGKGAYITGNGENFTIYIEIKQNGIEFELPDDVSVNVVFLVSGNRSSNGNLTAKWMRIITDITSINEEYDSVEFEEVGSWYISEGNWGNL